MLIEELYIPVYKPYLKDAFKEYSDNYYHYDKIKKSNYTEY